MDALLWELLSEGNADDTVEVLIRLHEQSVLPAIPIEMVAQIGSIISCRIRRGDIARIRRDSAVASMKAGRRIGTEPAPERPIEWIENQSFSEDIRSASGRRPDTPLTGKGVFLGLADWGLDFTHPNFLTPDGKTRFHLLWDQGAAYDRENVYGYGRLYTAGEINDALASETPFATLGYHPGKADLFQQGMHGTHVLDIAAGNGRVGESGMAPEAMILGVHLATRSMGDLEALGDSVRVFDALHFLDAEAGHTGLVINMSVGSHGDSHTGNSLIEQAIDTLVTRRTGRAVVQSCGNYQTTRAHASGTVSPDQPSLLRWMVPPHDKSQNELEIWYDGRDVFTVSLISPQGETLLHQAGTGPQQLTLPSGQLAGRYYHRHHEPNTGLNHINLYLKADAGQGAWQILLHGEQLPAGGGFDAWIERDSACSSCQSYFSPEQASPLSNTGSICNGHHNIAVAACDGSDFSIGSFSSSGPTRDGRTKPDLTAPGVDITAARSAGPFSQRSDGQLCEKSGTSMAAPYVAGAVALYFEQRTGNLPDIHTLRQALFAACETHPTRTAHRFGHGVLNVSLFLSSSQPTIAMNAFNEDLFSEARRNRKAGNTGLSRRRAQAVPAQPVRQTPARIQAPVQPQTVTAEPQGQTEPEQPWQEPQTVQQAPCNCQQQQEVPVTVDGTEEAFYAETAWEEAETPTLMEWVEAHLPSGAGFGEVLGYWGEADIPAHLRDGNLAASLFDALHPKRPDTDRAYFERFFRAASLPGRRAEIRPGALVVRRQYGHSMQAVWGFVERMDGPYAYLRTPAGVQRARVLDGAGNLHWEAMVVDGAGANGQEESYAEEVKGFSIDPNGNIIPPAKMSKLMKEIYEAMTKTETGKIAFRNLIVSPTKIIFGKERLNGPHGETQGLGFNKKTGLYKKAYITFSTSPRTDRFATLDADDPEWMNVVGVHESLHAVIPGQIQKDRSIPAEIEMTWEQERDTLGVEITAFMEYRRTVRPSHPITAEMIRAHYATPGNQLDGEGKTKPAFHPVAMPDLWKAVSSQQEGEMFAEDWTVLCSSSFYGNVIIKNRSTSVTINSIEYDNTTYKYKINISYSTIGFFNEEKRITYSFPFQRAQDFRSLNQNLDQKMVVVGSLSDDPRDALNGSFIDLMELALTCKAFRNHLLKPILENTNNFKYSEFTAISYLRQAGDPFVFIAWNGLRDNAPFHHFFPDMREKTAKDLPINNKYLNNNSIKLYLLSREDLNSYSDLRDSLESGHSLNIDSLILFDHNMYNIIKPIENNSYKGNPLFEELIDLMSAQVYHAGQYVTKQGKDCFGGELVSGSYLSGTRFSFDNALKINYGPNEHALPELKPDDTETKTMQKMATFMHSLPYYRMDMTGHTDAGNPAGTAQDIQSLIANVKAANTSYKGLREHEILRKIRPTIANNNMQLSYARAWGVQDYMTNSLKVLPGLIQVQGAGEQEVREAYHRVISNLLKIFNNYSKLFKKTYDNDNFTIYLNGEIKKSEEKIKEVKEKIKKEEKKKEISDQDYSIQSKESIQDDLGLLLLYRRYQFNIIRENESQPMSPDNVLLQLVPIDGKGKTPVLNIKKAANSNEFIQQFDLIEGVSHPFYRTIKTHFKRR